MIPTIKNVLIYLGIMKPKRSYIGIETLTVKELRELNKKLIEAGYEPRPESILKKS
jgi:hypothetical protein